MDKLNVMVVTTSRADYGLLYPLIKKFDEDDYFHYDLAVTGSHLSALHGNTVEKIKEDGFGIAESIDITMQNDTENDICNAIAKGLKGFSSVFQKKKFDLMIVLGDRYELWSACIAAAIHKIPIAHIHGGEVTEGAIDNSIRHSITKMAAIHFPSIDLYGKRIIQMGEKPERVFVVGALGIDNINNIELMTKEELSIYSGVNFDKDIALMTYHPVTLDEYKDASKQIYEVLEALLETDLFVLITMPNADTGSKTIFEIIEKYIQLYPQKFQLIKNLSQRAYLSAMKYAKLMIGNSSSGIIESASFKLPVVNIGDRQAGRFKPGNVVDVSCSKSAIISAIYKVLSNDFMKSISNIENPYGDGNTAERIIKVLKSIDFTKRSNLLKKEFYHLYNLK
jgi:UDP-hydrolysing UDP-N-acetyl-D-glucosamine 2-epimerase